MQTLVGPIVRPGDEFSVSSDQVTVAEGQSVTVSAEAGGAQKMDWILRRDGRERVVGVAQRTFTFDAGRVAGDATEFLQFRSVHAGWVKMKNIPIVVKEAIAEPEFRLTAPATWDGRSEVVLAPAMANLKEMQAQGAGDVRHTWSVSGPAVIKETDSGGMRLKRTMGSGALTITLTIDNGGAAVTRSATIAVAEPAPDAWVPQVPAADERPVNGQCYARDDRGFGMLVWNGTLAEPRESVFLRVFAGDERLFSQEQKLGPDRKYAFLAPLKAGLVTYRAEWGVGDRVLHTAADLVCGDAFVITGQSNAVSTDWGEAPAPPVQEWVRTDVSTIYGRLLWRVREARLTHGIRGILWHQGENDQGADGPTGGFGWETYRTYFHALAGSWKQGFPNLQHLHLFQIWPKACSMGVDGSDNRLREVQRTLPRDFSRLSVMSTLGILPPGGCHYPAEGYAEFARLIAPLMERDHFGVVSTESLTLPNLLKARFSGATRESVVLEFDQPVVWNESLASEFYLDGAEGAVASGSGQGTTITLRLKAPAAAAAGRSPTWTARRGARIGFCSGPTASPP